MEITKKGVRMKFAKLSLAAIVALGFASSAMADVDVQFGGQAVLYYQTLDQDKPNGADFFDKTGARGNVGLQIKSKADLGNDFQAGLTMNIIGTMGLEGNLVGGVMQTASGDNNDLGGYWIPEVYVAKTVGNTTVKLGRQYLKSPLAFSEGWNVFKNSFEAGILINKDIPNTTVVLGMVNKANKNGLKAIANGLDMSNFSQIVADNANNDGSVYILGIINKSIPNLNVALWGYQVTSYKSAVWGDLSYKVEGVGVPLTIALQGANIDPDGTGSDDTSMWGAKVSTKLNGFAVSVAYDDVDDGTLPVHNQGTHVKTKLFVQQILNQASIKKDAETWQFKVVTPAYQGFKLVAQYASTDAGNANCAKDNNEGADNDLDELDLIVKGKVLGTNLLVAYVNQDFDAQNADQDLFRVVARYKF